MKREGQNRSTSGAENAPDSGGQSAWPGGLNLVTRDIPHYVLCTESSQEKSGIDCGRVI
jgi:hypothetical protein